MMSIVWSEATTQLTSTAVLLGVLSMKEPIVQTKNGTLRGVVQRNVENEDYCAFKGIPYAQPPIGDLRFKVSLILPNKNYRGW